MSAVAVWAPDRGDIMWINSNPQIGKEMKNMSPLLVLSAKTFNARTGLVVGFPMSSNLSNATNPFAVDNAKGAEERSFIICNQPKSLDWRGRGAKPHPWAKVTPANT